MPAPPTPVEIKVSYRVARKDAPGWVRQFNNGINDGDLLPPHFKPVQAEIQPDPADAEDAVIWVIFRPAE